MTPTAPRPRLVWLLLLVGALASCNAYPDKRILQYLNTEGFGNRYTGNAEQDNYVTIGDVVGLQDAYNPEDLDLQGRVDIDGTIVLPEIGAVHVAGMTRTEIEAFLTEKYLNYFDLVDIKVTIKTSGKVYFIFGEVEREGKKPFTGDITVFEAVMEAEPKRSSANTGRILVIRPDPRDPIKIPVDLGDIMPGGDSSFNVGIQERDIIWVPPTMLAQLGYFIDNLLFPVKQVLSGLTGAIFTLREVDRYQNNRNNDIY